MSFVPAWFAVGGERATRTALVIHGVLGSGQNWRGFTRRLAQDHPEWRFLLPDLRHHGASRPGPRPTTVADLADDLARLASEVGAAPSVVIGHSLGGKVALEHARRHPEGLTHVAVLDSSPGAHPAARSAGHEVYRVLDVLRGLAWPLARRQDVTLALQSAGLGPGVSQWMTTSLERVEGGYAPSLDLDAIAELLDDYFARDLWDFLATPRERPRLHVLIAESSDRVASAQRARVASLPREANVDVFVLPGSGHFVHADNPEGLRDWLGALLRAAST